MNLAAHVRECRTRAGIDTRHAAVSDCGEEHRYHRYEHGGYRMPMRPLAHHSVHRHRRRGLDYDHPVENQVPQS